MRKRKEGEGAEIEAELKRDVRAPTFPLLFLNMKSFRAIF